VGKPEAEMTGLSDFQERYLQAGYGPGAFKTVPGQRLAWPEAIGLGLFAPQDSV
jgi:hypothetical protein